MKVVDVIATILLIIGGLVWGGVGVADFNPIMWIFIAVPKMQHFLYIAFGLAALWKLGRCCTCRCKCTRCGK